MAKNIKQVYDTNPSTVLSDNDLLYTGLSPYGASDDSAIKYSDLAHQISATSFSPENTAYAAINGSNVTGDGNWGNPFADPFTASNTFTGSVSDPVLVIYSSGVYSTTSFNLKPNVSLQGSINSPLTVTNPIGLDATWSGAASGTTTYLIGCNFVNGLSLDFSTASVNGETPLWMIDCVTGDASIFTGKTSHIPTIRMNNCKIEDVNFQSVTVIAQGIQAVNTLIVEPSAGGGPSNITIVNSHLPVAMTLTASAGNSSTVVIKSCSAISSLIISSAFVTLTIDESSIPSGGITYSGGASASQVTVLRGDLGSGVPVSLTSGKILRSDGTRYTSSTATFADTYTASNLLYSNGANTVTGLATANSGVLVTNGSGVPSISTSTLPEGAFFANAYVRWADPSGSNSNAGKSQSPYASPFYASDNNSGTATLPKLIIANVGTYSASSFAIKPNVHLMTYYNPDNNGNLGNVWSVSADITLDSSWSSAAAGTSTTLQNIKFDTNTVFDLDFSGATNGVALNFVNCTIGLGFSDINGATAHIPIVNFIGGRIGSGGLPLSSVNSTIKNHRNDGILSIVAASGGGAGTYIIDGSIITGNVSIAGSSGNVQAVTITNSKLSGTLSLNNTFCTLSIDATSIPSGGITYSGGATSSQVTIIGNAPSLSFNNAFTAQNGITPAAITSSSSAVAWNLNTAPNATHTATENTTLSAPTNQVNGNIYVLRFQQHASSAKTFGFNSTYKFPGGVVPVVSTGASAVDIFTFRSDGTNMQCIGISQNIS